jgi:hypothetical protein
MELIGELERFFARVIYPNRVIVAVIIVGIAGVLAAVAARRGWHHLPRRHPGPSALALVIGLAVGLPLLWYLASPLVISNSIDEPAPVAAAAPAAPSGSAPPAPSAIGPQPSASSGSPASEPPRSMAPGRPAPTEAPSLPPLKERRGMFVGADEFHFGRGTARLIETAPGQFVVRLEGFEVRNGPDLFVYLSPDPSGYADGAIEIARLKADRGNQNYEVPAGTDLSGARSVVIWCKQFSVLFATAPLG